MFKTTTIDNVNIYGNNMPTKNFCYFHPFHNAIITQYRSFDSGIISKESEFVLLISFPFYCTKMIGTDSPRPILKNIMLFLPIGNPIKALKLTININLIGS
jgi:hypothetical protein